MIRFLVEMLLKESELFFSFLSFFFGNSKCIEFHCPTEPCRVERSELQGQTSRCQPVYLCIIWTVRSTQSSICFNIIFCSNPGEIFSSTLSPPELSVHRQFQVSKVSDLLLKHTARVRTSFLCIHLILQTLGCFFCSLMLNNNVEVLWVI